VETFRSSVAQLVLHYAGETRPPAQLPAIRGLLSAQRAAGALHLMVVKPDDAIRATVRSLGAASVEETSASFSDALIAYLGDRGDRGSFLGDSIARAMGGAS
jgi:hypothetical protein